MARSPLRLTRSGPLAEVMLCRPHARNALDLRTCLALRQAFEELGADPDVRVVLLRASGPSFCAGADVREREGRDERWIRGRRLAAFAAYEAVQLCPKPVIALIHGAVVGAGGELAMACDFILAASDTTFRFPEAQLGTVGATQRLQRVIGARGAKELLFTGRTMSAAEAERRGLVARVVPLEALHEAGLETATKIAEAPALALALTKQAVDLGGETDLARGVRIELAAIERSLASGGGRLDGPAAGERP